MTNDHIENLLAVRHRLVAARRELARTSIADVQDGTRVASLDKAFDLKAVQEAISRLDDAIEEERAFHRLTLNL